ncbi:MAG: hypothetical protein ABIK07_19570, partial [Planctomycetota bacterium]
MTTNVSGSTDKKVTSGARKKLLLSLIILLAVLLSSPVWGQGLWLDFFQNRAAHSLHARRPENALKWLAYAQTLDDGNARTQILLARAYRKSHDVEQAYIELKNYYQLAGSTAEFLQEQWLLKAQIGDNADLQTHLS